MNILLNIQNRYRPNNQVDCFMFCHFHYIFIDIIHNTLYLRNFYMYCMC